MSKRGLEKIYSKHGTLALLEQHMYVIPVVVCMYLVVVSSAQELDEAKSEKIRNEDDNPCRIASTSTSTSISSGSSGSSGSIGSYFVIPSRLHLCCAALETKHDDNPPKGSLIFMFQVKSQGTYHCPEGGNICDDPGFLACLLL